MSSPATRQKKASAQAAFATPAPAATGSGTRAAANQPPPSLDELRAAADRMFDLFERAGIDANKIRGGGLSEALVSLERGLTPSTTIHGADAHDADGGTVEQKNTHRKPAIKGKAWRTNWQYVIPAPLEGEKPTEFGKRVTRVWREKASSHHLLTILRGRHGTTIERSYRIESAFMAAYIGQWAQRAAEREPARQKDFHLNFSCAACKCCGEFWRVKQLQDLAVNYDEKWTPAKWRAFIDRRVESTCDGCKCE